VRRRAVVDRRRALDEETLPAARRPGGLRERTVDEGRAGELRRDLALRARTAEVFMAERDLTARDLPRLLATHAPRLHTQTHAHLHTDTIRAPMCNPISYSSLGWAYLGGPTRVCPSYRKRYLDGFGSFAGITGAPNIPT